MFLFIKSIDKVYVEKLRSCFMYNTAKKNWFNKYDFNDNTSVRVIYYRNKKMFSHSD